jgi:hypothetical protein
MGKAGVAPAFFIYLRKCRRNARHARDQSQDNRNVRLLGGMVDQDVD